MNPCTGRTKIIIKMFKLIKKVSFVTNNEIQSMVDKNVLPKYLGGNVELDHHKNWLKECNRLITNKTSTCHSYYRDTNRKGNEITTSKGFCETFALSQNNNRKRPSSDFIESVEKNQKIFLHNVVNDAVEVSPKENGGFAREDSVANDDVDVFIDE